MKNRFTVKRMTLDALMLALMCVIGMFSIPLGANIKVSLQLLMVYIICLTLPSVLDCIFIMVLYLLLGLFLPIYAGFNAGISPTFGYVIGFVIASPAIYFMNKIPKVFPPIRMGAACLVGLIVCYLVGTLFMMLYLNWDIQTTLLVSIVPYIPFDILKIVLAVLIVMVLPKNVING